MNLLLTRLIATIVLSTLFTASTTFGQNCYYPDGGLSTTDAACSSNGGACCPLGWECLSNGLCYYPPDGDYGRYTCTDQSWQSSSCPQICTENNTATGDEALLQCSDGSWCCDGDRSWNCCTTADTNFFSLTQGKEYASITALYPTSSVTSSGGSNSPPSTSDSTPTSASGGQSSASSSPSSASSGSSNGGSSSSSPQSSSASTTSSNFAGSSSGGSTSHASSTTSGQSAVTQMSVTTGTDGAASTVYLISTVAASPTSTSSHTSSSSSHLGLIIGLAAGIPGALLLSAILLCCLLLRRRRQRRNNPPGKTLHDPQYDPANMTDLRTAYGATRPELDSFPVASGRTKSHRKSELQGSDPTTHIPHHSPATSTGTAPPQYSPAAHMTQVQEEPQELWGGYVPYRVARAELPEQGASPPLPPLVDSGMRGEGLKDEV